jgi:hypothetical protein
MRRSILPILMFALGLQAISAQPAPRRVRELRPGVGEPRLRDPSAARTAQPRGERVLPYKAAKPGEGAPKD